MMNSRYRTRNGAIRSRAGRACPAWCSPRTAAAFWTGVRVVPISSVVVVVTANASSERRRSGREGGELRPHLRDGGLGGELAGLDAADGRPHDDLEVRARAGVPAGRVVDRGVGRGRVVGLRRQLLVRLALRGRLPRRDVTALRPDQALVQQGLDEVQRLVELLPGLLAPAGQDQRV